MGTNIKKTALLACLLFVLALVTSCFQSSIDSLSNEFYLENNTGYEIVFENERGSTLKCPPHVSTLLDRQSVSAGFDWLFTDGYGKDWTRIRITTDEGRLSFGFYRYSGDPLSSFICNEGNWDIEVISMEQWRGQEYVHGIWTLVLEQEEFDAVIDETVEYYRDLEGKGMISVEKEGLS